MLLKTLCHGLREYLITQMNSIIQPSYRVEVSRRAPTCGWPHWSVWQQTGADGGLVVDLVDMHGRFCGELPLLQTFDGESRTEVVELRLRLQQQLVLYVSFRLLVPWFSCHHGDVVIHRSRTSLKLLIRFYMHDTPILLLPVWSSYIGSCWEFLWRFKSEYMNGNECWWYRKCFSKFCLWIYKFALSLKNH